MLLVVVIPVIVEVNSKYSNDLFEQIKLSKSWQNVNGNYTV